MSLSSGLGTEGTSLSECVKERGRGVEGETGGAENTSQRSRCEEEKCPVAERVKHKCKKKDSFQLIFLVLRFLRKKASPVIFVMGFLIRHCIHKN